MTEGATGRKLEKGRDIASGAPSFNWQSQVTRGLRTVGVAEQVVREMAVEKAGIPFGSRRIWAPYPRGLKVDPSGFSENDFKRASESSPLPHPGQSREFHADIGYEAPWSGLSPPPLSAALSQFFAKNSSHSSSGGRSSIPFARCSGH